MSTSSERTRTEAARSYETLFVPALFGQWAAKVADSADIHTGQRVIDVACGTGVLAREVARRTGPGGRVAAIDPDPGMIALAGELAPHVACQRGVAEDLPFLDQSFDAVVSQFGLMFFLDRPRALREMRRVLRPGGRLAIAVWDSLDTMPAYASEVALLERMEGTPAARALRAPFVLGDRGEVAALLTAAGFMSARVETHRGTARFPSIRSMVEADLRGWLPVMGVTLAEGQVGRILTEAEKELAAYRRDDGQVEFAMSVHLATGHTPT